MAEPAVVRPAAVALVERPVTRPAGDDTRARAEAARRQRSLRQEFGVRLAVTALLLVFCEAVAIDHVVASVVRLTAVIGLVLNVPYYLAIRTGFHLRAQAYLRMLIDVGLITTGLYGAGGLGAAPYVGVYAIVPVYTAFVFSSRACVLATGFATLTYLAVAFLQVAGVLPYTRPPLPEAGLIAAFNLLALNIVGGLAALLAEAYRASRHRLAALYDELARAHDESLKLTVEIQAAARRYVLSEVVAGVTHDVRNALQGAFGHLWLARRTGHPLAPEAAAHLEQVEQACESAMRIIRTTLDMARRPTPEREVVRIPDVVRRVAELKTFDLRRDGIALQVEMPDGLPRVLASPYQLQQVLLNVVGNAQDELRVSAGRREIGIAGLTAPGHVVVEVWDTGPGIAPGVLPHVFEPFYTTKATGTGLGLAVSAGIMEAFGGTIAVENRREGGALFRLTLPAADGTPPD